ncbi:MAG TPA: hypothetical protein VFJ16_08320 [Longimicrobium sp.]|nr:hypothetical protein [Longimicrobium sp.]
MVTTAQLRARMRFAILDHRRRQATIVHGSHRAPDAPEFCCFDGFAIGWDGEGATVEGDPCSTGSTFLQRGCVAGHLDVTRQWDDVVAHLTRGGAR